MLETIGKRVKKLRKDLNMGQKEINVSQTHLSQIETESITKPKQNVLNKIAKMNKIGGLSPKNVRKFLSFIVLTRSNDC